MMKVKDGIIRILLTMVLALLIGAILIVAIGEDPILAYKALLKGAFVGKLSLGTTLASFTPLILTSTAFVVAATAGAFNVGVEGEVFLGGLVAAYIGYKWTFLPAPLLYIACFAGAMLVTACWAFIPAYLKAYYNVSEVCSTILMNSVALYITSYFVSGPMSAGSANPQSPPVAVRLHQFMRPSSANVGLFLAIAIVLGIIWMLYKTSLGYRFRLVGTNPRFADYSGIDSKKVFIQAMMLSGMLGGIAGTIEVLGVYGYFLNNFATGLGSNGMLAAGVYTALKHRMKQDRWTRLLFTALLCVCAACIWQLVKGQAASNGYENIQLIIPEDGTSYEVGATASARRHRLSMPHSVRRSPSRQTF